MTIRGNLTYNRYRVRRNTTELGISFEARNEQVSQTLLIPGIRGINLQRMLFGLGEPGWLYDWSDRSTMFTNSTGVTPVTASGQTVGLHLDKSQGLVLGPELFNDGPDLTFVGISNWDQSTRTLQVIRTSSAAQSVSLSNLNPNKHYLITASSRQPIDGYSSAAATVDSTPTFVGIATLNLRLIVTGSNNYRFRHIANNRGEQYNNFSFRELPGNHRYQASADSRFQYVEDETGHYGLSDGVDDFMETNPIDFTATDKMTVWWGGRKLSDATAAIIAELSADINTNNGALNLVGPNTSSTSTFRFASKGTTLRGANADGFVAPVSSVVTGIGDISGDVARLRINGVQEAEDLGDQGTGNYGNHKLYFGSRAGTSLPFNGREYMCIGRGAQTATPLIQRVEQEVRRKIKGLVF